MTVPILSAEPTRFRAGDSVSWRRSWSDYPASAGWSLAYTLISSTAKRTITGAADGDAHLVTLTAADTDDWPAGRYTLIGHVSKAPDRVEVLSLPVEVLPDLAAATTYDTRTHARRMLEALEAALEGRATRGQLDVIEVAIYSRTTRRDKGVLIEARARYLTEVRREDAAAGVATGAGRVLVRY